MSHRPLERRARGYPHDGAAPRPVLSRLLLAPNDPPLRAGNHESLVDRGTHGLRAARKGPALWSAREPVFRNRLRCLEHGSARHWRRLRPIEPASFGAKRARANYRLAARPGGSARGHVLHWGLA